MTTLASPTRGENEGVKNLRCEGIEHILWRQENTNALRQKNILAR